MVREQGPGEDRQRPHFGQRGQAGDEVGAILVIPEDGAALESPHHHVVEGPGGVEPGLAWHKGSIAAFALFANVPYSSPILAFVTDVPGLFLPPFSPTGHHLMARILRARASSFSASASRFVARYSAAKLSKLVATLGCSGPRTFSQIASERL